ncbi:MAG: DsrE/DsrF-like family protein [Candidatus Scalindua rubra]|uniref:DsrE/DsrF-like family protein n=1 Tax=Candidatus Scalindua rubra TaxID=1872076 RepID=A0A1E3X819_9BACT|nr:MAG: DsrE/DsrF-like family protein [Candidatus Scalindua rubra]
MIKKLGILLTTSTESENTHTVIKLTEAALNEGVEVHIFLMCDGVYHLNHERFVELAKQGARIVVCAHNAIERKEDKKDFVLWGSQYDLACMVKECDRFLAFN